MGKINHFGLSKRSKSIDTLESFFCRGISSYDQQSTIEPINQSSHRHSKHPQDLYGHQNGYYNDYYKTPNLTSNQKIEYYRIPKPCNQSKEFDIPDHYNEKRNGILFNKDSMNLRIEKKLKKSNDWLYNEDQVYQRSDLRKIYGRGVIDYMTYGQDDDDDDDDPATSTSHHSSFRSQKSYPLSDLHDIYRKSNVNNFRLQHSSTSMMNSYPYNISDDRSSYY